MAGVWSLYDTVVHQHDLRFVALAAGICALGCLTAVSVAQHALKAETKVSRRSWLLFAGSVTGLSVWTTHFTAMLGYRNDLDIHFDLATASLSILAAVCLAMAGWVFGFLNRQRGILAGIVIGLSIALAHFLDMHAIRVAGSVAHNHIASMIAIALGLALGVVSGWLFAKWTHYTVAWPAAAALFGAIVSLHFVAMSGVTITPGIGTVEEAAFWATSDELATVVVVAFVVLLTAAIAFTWHSLSVARATAVEQSRLIKALEDLRTTQDHHQAYVELNPQIAWVADPDGQVTEIAPRWTELVGKPLEEGVGKGWASVVHPDDLPGVAKIWAEAIKTGDGDLADVRYRVRLVDGTYRWFRARARPRWNDEGSILAWYGSLEDIHEQVLAETALRASEERFRIASYASNDVIWDWSFGEQRAAWAGAYEKVLGYPELHRGTDLNWWLDHIHPDDRQRVLVSQTVALDEGADYWNEEYRFLVVSGDWIDVKTSCVIVRSDEGRPVRLVGSMLDITQQKVAEAELNWAAYHDPLTKLPNRALYQKSIQSAIEEARANCRSVALVVLDLNSFKELNDTLGHAAGDKVLEETARRLSDSIPEGATVARLGGDEFAVILPDLLSTERHRDVVHLILEHLVAPIVFDEMHIPISYCVGVAIWPRDADDPGELLIAADLALYASKAEMPGSIREFSPSLKDASQRRSRMLTVARAALAEDRIEPFYQPKIDLHTGLIMGWEALLRIRGKRGEILPPAEIEAAFSDADITVRLTDRMFSGVFSDLARWQSQGMVPGRIAVNISAGDFRRHDLAERLQSHAHAHGQSLSEIDIEVTETVLIGQLGPEVSRMLQQLRALGVMVALDDFGTGYASLSHLQQFPVDVIKIDRSFIERIDETDPPATAVIDAVLQMARVLGLQTVAEGVETTDQARYLRAHGCTIGQGYLFSRAVAASEVPTILSSQSFDRWEFGSLRPA
ncbi:EAL domain-containing protein [Aurantimonas sp. A2-1-M11]|uniref:bifunctional diguanylate cyclase/phosphodiesterase n=1 Tax=Aurantimonas sp. A2-1-M11 TaxID=3113712 RepID=UPI002F9408D3